MLRTLRSRLLVVALAVELLVLLVLGWALQQQLTTSFTNEVRVRAETIDKALGAALAPQLAQRDLAGLRDTVRDSAAEIGVTYLQLRSPRDGVVAASGTVPHAGQVTGQLADAETPTAAGGVIHYTVPVRIGTQTYGELDFGISAAPLAEARQQLMVRLAWIGGAGLLLTAALLWGLTGILTRGLEQLSEAVRNVGAGELSQRVPVRGSDEVAGVAQAFNTMSQALAERVQALQESEQRQRTLVEALAEGVVFQDANDRVLACNDAAPRILGLTRNQLLGLDSMDPRWRAIHRNGSPFDFSQHPSVLALATGQSQRDVLMGVHRGDGTLAWISINSEPLILPGASAPHATVTSFADMTERIENEVRLQQLNATLEDRVALRTTELAAARDAAEHASAAKSEFLSRMSHELRTPLNAILGFAQVLQMQPDNSPQQRATHLAQIEKAGWHLLELINEVLDLSRIESGVMAVEREAIDLAAVLAECLPLAEPLAARAQVALLAEPTLAPVRVLGDRLRLRQVVMNLLSNGIKYNRSGGQVLVRLAPEADQVALYVTDTGRGFTQGQVEQLYQPFNRLGAEGDATEGTGIGLLITRRFVELMGGSITLATSPGEGSTFKVRLPRATDEPARPAASPVLAAAVPGDAGRPTRHVLYIEDNASNTALMEDIMRLRPDLRLHCADSGHDGLLAAATLHPHLIVTDIALPDIDGFDVCRRLRADPRLEHVPLVALSANAMEGDVQRGLQAGFDAYLTKPLSVAAFLQTLQRLLDHRSAT
jgi:PAS domain S-box-containing protein